jgi:hypothetical protein
MRTSRYAAFGLRLDATASLALRPDDGAPRPALTLWCCSERALKAQWSGSARLLWEADRDGVVVDVARGHGGEHRIRAAGLATFLLAADGATLACATAGDRPCDWRRLLDELALPCASLLCGNEALHGGAVAFDGGAVALLAPSGGGKSTLCAALLEHGGTLLSDDVVVLADRDGRVVAEPGAPALKLATGVPGVEERIPLDPAPLTPPPLTLVVVLARGGVVADEPRLEPWQASPMAVLAHALSFPSTPERAAARLMLYRDLLAQARVVRLLADARALPSRLAELVAAAVTAPEAVSV